MAYFGQKKQRAYPVKPTRQPAAGDIGGTNPAHFRRASFNSVKIPATRSPLQASSLEDPQEFNVADQLMSQTQMPLTCDPGKAQPAFHAGAASKLFTITREIPLLPPGLSPPGLAPPELFSNQMNKSQSYQSRMWSPEDDSTLVKLLPPPGLWPPGLASPEVFPNQNREMNKSQLLPPGLSPPGFASPKLLSIQINKSQAYQSQMWFAEDDLSIQDTNQEVDDHRQLLQVLEHKLQELAQAWVLKDTPPSITDPSTHETNKERTQFGLPLSGLLCPEGDGCMEAMLGG